MTTIVKEFLRQSDILDMIDAYKFQELYDRANAILSSKEMRELTDFLKTTLEVEPLTYMTHVPENYYANIKTSVVFIPEGIQQLDDYAFADANISSLYLPKSLVKFTEEAFVDCNVDTVCLPNTITDYINNVEIDAYAGAYNGAFQLADSTGAVIKHITIPSGLSKEYSNHFQDCTSIEKITFEEGVTRIAPYTFSGCHQLTTVELPHSMKVIGPEVFVYCINLNKIIYNGTYDEFGKITFTSEWLSNGDGSEHWFTLVCKDGTYNLEVGTT